MMSVLALFDHVLGHSLVAVQSARKLSEAGKSLLDARHFKELLSVSPIFYVRGCSREVADVCSYS